MLHPLIKRYLVLPEGDFLVTGPPGSGKTRTMAELIGHLIKTNGYDTSKVTVFCFNRRWAKILREMTAQAAGLSINEIQITTFFSYCAELIERDRFLKFLSGQISDYTVNIEILTAPQQWKLLKELLSGEDIKKDYPAAYKYMQANKYVARSFIQEVFDFILRAQENLLEPDMLKTDLYPVAGDLLYEITGIYKSYKTMLLDRDYFDYGRLLSESVSILKSNRLIKQFHEKSVESLVVDEFQEINRAQYEIIKNIPAKHRIYFGNDDQCTYAFRGSMRDNFSIVYEKLKKIEKKDNKRTGNILFLKKNYRFSNVIKKISEAFINQNYERIQKTASTIKNEDIPDSLVLKEFRNSLEEISYICSSIKRNIISRDIKPEKICIIVKGSDYKSRLLEKMLTDNGISYLMRSSRSMLDNPYVSYILDFLRLINLMDKMKGEPVSLIKSGNGITGLLQSVLCSEFTGLDPVEIEIFFNEQIKGEVSGGNKKYNAPGIAGLIGMLKSSGISGLAEFANAIERYAGFADSNILDFIYRFVNDEHTGILKNILYGPGRKNCTVENNAIIAGDFLGTIKDFSESNLKSNSISGYLDYLEDAIENSFLEEIEQSTKEFIKPGSINILSYHQCKGLEFDCVYMPFINEDYLPAKFGKTQLYDMQLFAYFTDKKIMREELLKSRHLQDERKIFYNGMTRASEYLAITSNRLSARSIFFDELEDICSRFSGKPGQEKQKVNTDKIKKAKKQVKTPGSTLFISTGNRWLERKKTVAKHLKPLPAADRYSFSMVKGLLYLKLLYPPGQWWSRTRETVNLNNPFTVSGKTFSYSALDNFVECPYKYKVNYFFNVRDNSGLALALGNAYHEIIRKFFVIEEKNPSWEAIEKIIKDTFDSMVHNDLEFTYLKKQLYSKALSDFNKYFEKLAGLKKNAVDIYPEKLFSFNIEEDEITGRIDLIAVNSDGTVELIDFKSGAKNYQLMNKEIEMQLRIYRMAIDSCSEFEGLLHNAKGFSLKYVFLGDEKKQEHELPPDFYGCRAFHEKLKELLSKIKEEKFKPLAGGSYACRNCTTRVLCSNSSFGAQDI